MIILDIIKLKLRMPSTARALSGFGALVGAAGSLALLLAVPLPVPCAAIVWFGVVIHLLGEWRLRSIRRAGR